MSRHRDAMMEVFRNGRVLRISMVDAATSQEQHSLHSALATLGSHVLSSTPQARCPTQDDSFSTTYSFYLQYLSFWS
jgi:hypothetical protein